LAKDKEKTNWWGQFDFSSERMARWQIGPLDLTIERQDNEWRLVTSSPRDFLEETAGVFYISKLEDQVDGKIRRYACKGGETSLSVMPMLADRSIIARPETPFFVPSSEEVFVYISSPMWLRVSIKDGKRILEELPIYRPSDTWFGSSTISGELCYATKTHARLSLSYITERPYRATTAVKVDNNTKEPLLVERIKIPVPNLSLFVNEKGNFWTESLKFLKDTGDDHAQVNIYKRPIDAAGKVSLVAPPRAKPAKNIVMKVFNSILG
jgi:hypothetical protein